MAGEYQMVGFCELCQHNFIGILNMKDSDIYIYIKCATTSPISDTKVKSQGC